MATQVFAKRLNKPFLVVQLDHGVAGKVVASVIGWLRQHEVKTLNVAGQRESKRPGIHGFNGALLAEMDGSNSNQGAFN